MRNPESRPYECEDCVLASLLRAEIPGVGEIMLCPRCEGSGVCPDCEGGDACDACLDTGKCLNCDFEGVIYV